MLKLKNKLVWKDWLISILYGVVVTCVFGVLALLPLLNIFIIFLPVPYIYLSIRKGLTAGLNAIFISALLIWLVWHPLYCIIFLMIVLFIFFAVRSLILFKVPVFEAIVLSSGAVLIVLCMVIGGVYLYVQKDLVIVIITSLRATLAGSRVEMEHILKAYQNLGLLGKDLTLDGLFTQLEQVFRIVVPSFLMIGSMVIGFLNYITSIWILKKKGTETLSPPPFIHWSLPHGVSMGLFTILLAAFIGSLLALPNFDLVMITIMNLVYFVFMVQGLSFGAFFLTYKKVPKGLQIPLLLIGFVFLPYMISLLGMLEQFFHIRTIMLQQNRKL